MKRILIGFLAVCLLVTLCGCTGGLSNTDGESTTTTTTTTPAKTTVGTKPTLKSKITYPVTIWVAADSMRVRKGPGTQHESLGGTVKGDKWTATAREGDWFKIEFKDGAVGYVNAQYVSLTEPK